MYVSTDGSIETSGDLRISTTDIHPGKIVEIEPMVFELATSEFGDPVFVEGDPPAPFVDDSEEFPPEPPNQPVERQRISGETRQNILDARDNGDVQKQIDHVLDILDVLDLD